MPTEAVTGTRSARTAKREKVKADEEFFAASPIADHSGNGSVQVVAPDGSIRNIDAGTPGWEDEVRALDPKHPSIRNA